MVTEPVVTNALFPFILNLLFGGQAYELRTLIDWMMILRYRHLIDPNVCSFEERSCWVLMTLRFQVTGIFVRSLTRIIFIHSFTTLSSCLSLLAVLE